MQGTRRKMKVGQRGRTPEGGGGEFFESHAKKGGKKGGKLQKAA